MKTITADSKLVAACGLYCGACGAYLKEKCPGCRENGKASWCKVRTCCQKHQYQSCADCKQHAQVSECPDYDNIISKLFGVIFRSDRKACVALIKTSGYDAFAKTMAANKTQSIKRK